MAPTYRTLRREKCNVESIQEKKKLAKHWVSHRIVTQEVIRKCGWVQDDGCGMYRCAGWRNRRLLLSEEVRAMEPIAKGDHRCWLWEEGSVSFPGAWQT